MRTTRGWSQVSRGSDHGRSRKSGWPPRGSRVRTAATPASLTVAGTDVATRGSRRRGTDRAGPSSEGPCCVGWPSPGSWPPTASTGARRSRAARPGRRLPRRACLRRQRAAHRVRGGLGRHQARLPGPVDRPRAVRLDHPRLHRGRRGPAGRAPRRVPRRRGGGRAGPLVGGRAGRGARAGHRRAAPLRRRRAGRRVGDQGRGRGRAGRAPGAGARGAGALRRRSALLRRPARDGGDPRGPPTRRRRRLERCLGEGRSGQSYRTGIATNDEQYAAALGRRRALRRTTGGRLRHRGGGLVRRRLRQWVRRAPGRRGGGPRWTARAR